MPPPDPRPTRGARILRALRRHRLLAAGAGLATALALTYRGLFLGEVSAGRDMFRLFIPNAWLLDECLHRGVLPLWNPFIRMGQPFAATLQAQAFYPPNVLAVLAFGPLWGLTVLFLFHVVLAALGVFLAARALRTSFAASCLAAAVFALSPFFYQLCFIQNAAAAAAWSGFVVLGALALKRRPSVRAAALLAFVVGMSALCGSPITTLCQLVVVLLVLVRGRRRLRAIAFAGVALVVGVMLAAVELFPGLEMAHIATRQLRDPLTWSVPFGQFASAFLAFAARPLSGYWGADQHFFSSLFLGTTALVLTGFAVSRRRRSAPFVWGALVFGLLVLGRNFPPSAWLLSLPPLNHLRYPVKYFTGFALCIALASAFGFDRLGAFARRVRPSGRTIRRGLLGGVIAFLLAVPLLRLHWFRPGLQIGATWGAVCLGLLWIAFGTIPRGPRRATWVRTAFGAVLLCEYLIQALSFGPIGWIPAGKLGAPSHLGAAIPRPYTGRISVVLPTDPQSGLTFDPIAYSALSRDGLVPLETMPEHLSLVEGYSRPSPPAERLVDGSSGPVPRSVYDFLGTSYFVRYRAPPFPNLERVADEPGISVLYRSKTALPRAFVVYGARKASDTEAIAALRDPSEPFRHTAYLASGTPLTASPGCVGLTPAKIREGIDEVSVRLNACAEGYLVLTDAWFPGWHARVDGRPVKLERADWLGRAVKVPPGTHRVTLHYRPVSFVLGAWVSTLALLLLLAALIFTQRVRSARS